MRVNRIREFGLGVGGVPWGVDEPSRMWSM